MTGLCDIITKLKSITNTVLLQDIDMKLTAEEVRHIALLARLGLSDEEVEKFRNQLSDILVNFEALEQVDTTGLPPTSQSINLENVFRPDEPRPSLPVPEVLANAPALEENSFKVNAVLE
jgi:aspartyl-tRNA(Asn)/glutamyl-tRNA(Gln) amidotransferase subunit C